MATTTATAPPGGAPSSGVDPPGVRVAAVELVACVERAIKAQEEMVEQARRVSELADECVSFCRLGSTVASEAGEIVDDFTEKGYSPSEGLNTVRDLVDLIDLVSKERGA